MYKRQDMEGATEQLAEQAANEDRSDPAASDFRLALTRLMHSVKKEDAAQTDLHARKCLDMAPVSYTHLDVYKRQDINIPNNDLVFFKESYVSETRSGIPTWASKVATLKAVSYTHLSFHICKLHQTLLNRLKETVKICFYQINDYFCD